MNRTTLGIIILLIIFGAVVFIMASSSPIRHNYIFSKNQTESKIFYSLLLISIYTLKAD